MVSLAMSAIGVVVLIVAVDGGHNRHAENMESGIWNLERDNPNCEKQKAKVGEAKDGDDCGPATATLFSTDPKHAILVCCEFHLVCKKGHGHNEYKCQFFGGRIERDVEALSEEGTSLDQAKEEGKSLDNAKSKSQVKRAL